MKAEKGEFLNAHGTVSLLYPEGKPDSEITTFLDSFQNVEIYHIAFLSQVSDILKINKIYLVREELSGLALSKHA